MGSVGNGMRVQGAQKRPCLAADIPEYPENATSIREPSGLGLDSDDPESSPQSPGSGLFSFFRKQSSRFSLKSGVHTQYTGSIFDGQAMEMFLTPKEKHVFSEWVEPDDDHSFLTTWLDYTGVFDRIIPLIPDAITPNILCLLGTLAVVQNWYLVLQYEQQFEHLTTLSTIFSLSLCYLCHGVHGRYAAHTMNDTPLTHLFKHSCDALTLVFLVSSVSQLFTHDLEMQWLAVHSSLMVFLYKQLSAFAREAGIRYQWFVGPGEMVVLTIYLLLLKVTFGLEWLIAQYLQLYQWGHDQLIRMLMIKSFVPSSPYSWISSPQPDPVTLMKDFLVSVYCVAFVAIFVSLAARKNIRLQTKVSVMFILTYRMIPTFFKFLIGYIATSQVFMSSVRVAGGGSSTSSYFLFRDISPSLLLLSQHLPKTLLTSEGTIVEGLFLTVVCSDIVLAKMAKRQLHSSLLILCFSHLLPYTHVATVVMIVAYYCLVLSDLCWYMNLPLLANVKNVYCDGVFDLCHIGHKNLFRAALKHGNRLFVGVCGDEDCAKYKRPPIMSCAERCREILGCKAVTRVIPNAPTFGLTKEFLKKHRIHVVCCGEEYIERYPDPKNDPYYRVPREMGIARPLPRTQSLSTSDLIRRIQSITKDADDRNDK
ncbi:unnamed protein product [Amoebophrya sp. A25]|nr:unnamed protein product [Amoebophrya sp. A25]|eukprot:GSA25T00017525001.1